MTADEPRVGVAHGEVGLSAVRSRNPIMVGVRAGLAIHASAAVLFAALAALRIAGCDTADSLAAALFFATVVDLIAGLIMFVWMARSNPLHRRGAAAGSR